MDKIFIINGNELHGEQAVRNYCFNYTRKGFKQDFRLANGARSLPLAQLLELLSKLGHSVETLD